MKTYDEKVKKIHKEINVVLIGEHAKKEPFISACLGDVIS
jgi:hypothetical protein